MKASLVGAIIAGALFSVAGYLVTHQNRPEPAKTFVAICDGKKYQFQGVAFRTTEHGCVTFYSEQETKAWICGCNLVAEVLAEEKK